MLNKKSRTFKQHALNEEFGEKNKLYQTFTTTGDNSGITYPDTWKAPEFKNTGDIVGYTRESTLEVSKDKMGDITSLKYDIRYEDDKSYKGTKRDKPKNSSGEVTDIYEIERELAQIGPDATKITLNQGDDQVVLEREYERDTKVADTANKLLGQVRDKITIMEGMMKMGGEEMEKSTLDINAKPILPPGNTKIKPSGGPGNFN